MRSGRASRSRPNRRSGVMHSNGGSEQARLRNRGSMMRRDISVESPTGSAKTAKEPESYILCPKAKTWPTQQLAERTKSSFGRSSYSPMRRRSSRRCFTKAATWRALTMRCFRRPLRQALGLFGTMELAMPMAARRLIGLHRTTRELPGSTMTITYALLIRIVRNEISAFPSRYSGSPTRGRLRYDRQFCARSGGSARRRGLEHFY